MTKKLKWRLSKLPTAGELRDLVNDKVITNEEARDVLFTTVDEEKEFNEESLKSEIKFLRDMVEKLSENRTRTVEIIREVEVPYRKYSWIKPYDYWCGGGTHLLNTTSVIDDTGVIEKMTATAQNANFSEIKTFN